MGEASQDKIFLPAVRDEDGNIEIETISKDSKRIRTAILVSVMVFMLLFILLEDSFFEFIKDNSSAGLMLMGAFFLVLWRTIRMWTSKVTMAEQYIKVYDLWNTRIIRYEDIEQVGCVWNFRGLFVIECKSGRRITFPFGGVGTNEITELFIRKCSLRRCREVYEEIEMIRKKKAEAAG